MDYKSLYRYLSAYSILFASLMVSSCSVLPTNLGKREDLAWCNDRYLDMSPGYKNLNNMPYEKYPKILKLSESGYIYAVAALLTLQKESAQEFNFKAPPSLVKSPSLDESLWNGFQASTYIYKAADGDRVIVSFAGTNQIRDWAFHNFWIFPAQFKSARDYILKVAKLYDSKVYVTGYSLGGGLAAHVAKHEVTKRFVKEAWTFNPSPRVGWGISYEPEQNIYLLATSYEILGVFNRRKVGATEEHSSEDYDLIRSSSIYSHYRWVLARQILGYADLAEFMRSGKKSQTTEPLEILKTFNTQCSATDNERLRLKRKAWAENEK